MIGHAQGSRRLGFAGNAHMGRGGQGEFLRVMVRALERLGGGVAFARRASSTVARCVELPFAGGWRHAVHGGLGRIPRLRGRADWLTLLDDTDFDRRLAEAVEGLDLLDGVMGQVCRTFERLAEVGARRVLTCLNTHVLHLEGVLREEARRLGRGGADFVHPHMRRRALREIELADSVRVCSSFALETFVEHGVERGRLVRIPIGIDLEHFRPVARHDEVFRVLVVSSVTPRKGVHHALEAFERARLSAAELLIIGGTGDRWSRRLIDDYRTRLPGLRVEHVDVMSAPVERHYGAASVLLHPALEDGYGLIVPQALACGTPVIATRQTGASELVTEGVTGFVVEARDVEAMAERLRLLHADRELRERMAAAAPAAVSHLSYDWHAERVRALYERVLAT